MSQLVSIRLLIATTLLGASGCYAQAPASAVPADRDSETWILREYRLPCVPSDLAIEVRRARTGEDIDAAGSVYLSFQRTDITGVAVLDETPADPSRHPNIEFSPNISFGLAPPAIERLRNELITSARQGLSGHEGHDVTMNGETRRLGCGLLHARAPASATVGISCPAFDTTFEAVREWVHDWADCGTE